MSQRDLIGALDALVRLVDNADSVRNIRQGTVLRRARAVLERVRRGLKGPLPWTPFEAARSIDITEAQIEMLMRAGNVKREEATRILRETTDALLMVNSRYQVRIEKNGAGRWVILSIKRLDQMPVTSWRDLQRIKDELVGRECEGVQLFPAQSRLVDTANQYFLWCNVDPAFRFPFGFTERNVRAEAEGGAAQEPLEEGAAA